MPVAVPVNLGGSATAGLDYSAATTITVAAGATSASLAVTVTQDTEVEGDEQLTVALGTPQNARLGSPSSTTLTILDDDQLVVAFATAEQTVNEGAAAVAVEVRLNHPASAPVDVAYALGGTASAGTDFTAPSGSLRIAAGATSGSLSLTLFDDAVVECGETLVISLTSVSSGGTVGSPSVHTVRINDGVGTGALQVTARYPLHGCRWNELVKNDGPDAVHATDTACDVASQAAWNTCLHGGTLRRVDVPTEPSCTGLSMTDDLGAFVWRCDVRSGHAVFTTAGFASGMGLSQLVTGTQFKPNAVTVSGGSTTLKSAPQQWWPNAVVAVPNATSTGVPTSPLTAAETVYVVATSATIDGFLLSGPGSALVTLPGVTLTGSATRNCDASGKPGTTNSCVVQANGASRVWLEGRYAATSLSQYAVGTDGLRFSRFHQLHGVGTVALGPWSTGRGWGNVASNVTSVGVIDSAGASVGDAVTMSGFGNLAVDVRAANAGNNGFTMAGTSNTAVRVRAFNSSYNGIVLYGCDSCVLSDFVVSGGTGDALQLSTAPSATITQGTLLNVQREGVSAFSADGSTLGNVAVGNVNGRPVSVDRSPAMTFSHLGLAHSPNKALVANNSPDLAVRGHWLIGNTSGACTISGTTTGLTDSTCTTTGTDGSASYPSGSRSSAVLHTGLTLASAFVGKVSADDASNTSDAAGAATFPPGATLFDWLRFANSFRAYLADSTFPASGLQRQAKTGALRIWDWRLQATDTTLLNRTGTATSANSAYVADASCPSEVKGDVTATDARGNVYLLNATEVLLDSVGDDDGLCESHEVCRYTPNFGAYQGEDPLSSCLFDDALGTTPVVGVSMLGAATNGG